MSTNTIKHVALFGHIQACLAKANKENLKIAVNVETMTAPLVQEIKDLGKEISGKYVEYMLKQEQADELLNAAEEILANISPELLKYSDQMIDTLLISNIRTVAKQIHKKHLDCFEGKSFHEILDEFKLPEDKEADKKDMVNHYSFEGAIKANKDVLKECQKIKSDCEILETKISSIMADINSITDSQYISAENSIYTETIRLRKQGQTNPLALYGKQDPKKHGAFRFRCNKEAEDLMLIITCLGRTTHCSITSLENALRVYFPNALLKANTLTSLVRAQNDPRPSKKDKDSKRFRHAVSDSEKLEDKTDINHIQALILNLLDNIASGSYFKTKDKAFNRACNNADRNVVFEILDRLALDTKGYLLERRDPKVIITNNCKGLARPCKTSAMQHNINNYLEIDENVA
ncbi:MAG TPA: hypothetical protein DCL21_05575 [Alphaproteobacteria bacterium]|nr:hypothetical protein [Alphaproteobacteria bacterium]